MKILKSWLQDHIEESLPSDEIIEQALILKSSEVEGIEKVTTVDEKGNKIDDTVFDIKVLPDRAHYMLSHRGAAYDLCAVLNLTLKNKIAELPKTGNDVKVRIDSDLCTRYSAVLIKNISNGISPEKLKNRLEAIGARSINRIVDIANCAMFDTGQPLHVFDADKVIGGITVRLAKDNEEIETLSGQIIKLKNHQLIIADDNGPLALAGIKGGKRAEVDLETKNIILESANFNPTSVRKTSFEVGIRNDSSKRFENEITPHLTEKGISKFLDIIKKSSPDCKIGTLIDIYKKLPESWIVSVSHKNIESVLNFYISEKRIIEILEKLECKVNVKNGNYEIIPPFERLDLIISEDFIDEIGRIEGLDKVKSILPKADTSHEFSQGFLLSERIKDFFFEKGFSEIQTRTFSDKGDIEVSYPMASDKGFLRTNLIENISESIKLTENNAPLLGLDKVQIFEIGKTFPKTGEQLNLCFGISYIKKIKNKDQIIKSELENLIKEIEMKLGIKLNSKINLNIANIINLEKIDTKFTLSSIKIEKGSRNTFRQFSAEPFIVRDIALFVESSVEAISVEKTILNSIPDESKVLLAKGPDLFDQFEKEGKKSLAFRMIFQSNNRTLTDAEVNEIMEKIYDVVKSNGWEVR
jgi:phenylalanyl-tRNA synthetase beta chain